MKEVKYDPRALTKMHPYDPWQVSKIHWGRDILIKTMTREDWHSLKYTQNDSKDNFSFFFFLKIQWKFCNNIRKSNLIPCPYFQLRWAAQEVTKSLSPSVRNLFVFLPSTWTYKWPMSHDPYPMTLLHDPYSMTPSPWPMTNDPCMYDNYNRFVRDL